MLSKDAHVIDARFTRGPSDLALIDRGRSTPWENQVRIK
jgi:hypothetical protein